jgi:hypothetical protein
MTDRELIRGRLKTYFRMLAVHDPRLGNELVDVLDAYLDAKFKREWQGLTDEEANELTYASIAEIEAKLKEKNSGAG